MEPKEELQIIQCDGEAGMLLIDILEQKPECSFCGEKITKENFQNQQEYVVIMFVV